MPRRLSQIDTGHESQTEQDRGVAMADAPFWQTKSLDAMDRVEWESLCDRCGQCCLVKLEDEDSGRIYKTDIACKLFDAGSCSCSDYARRKRKVHDCVKLTPAAVREIRWLPATCAYKLIAEGRPLEPWHPLLSGSPESVHEAGMSVRGRIGGSEETVDLDDYPSHIVDWDDAGLPHFEVIADDSSSES